MNMKKITTFIFAVGLSIFILTSCNNSDRNKTSEKELELQKKEMDLKQKELELIEKELAQRDKSLTHNQSKKTTNETTSKAKPVITNSSTNDETRFLGKWTEDDYEIFTISKSGNKYHFESNLLLDGAKTELDAKLINGELVGRASDDGTGRNTIIKLDGKKLQVINLYDNNKSLHKVK